MVDWLQQAVEFHASALASSVSQSIVYHYKEGGTTSTTATIGTTQADDIESLGVAFTIRFKDFILERSLLDRKPERDDWIDWDGKRFDVVGLGSSGPVADEMDPYEIMWRIHAQNANPSVNP